MGEGGEGGVARTPQTNTFQVQLRLDHDPRITRKTREVYSQILGMKQAKGRTVFLIHITSALANAS